MSILIDALLPAFAMIALGCWMRRSGFLAEGFWPQAERLSYWVLLPALFVQGVATADLGGMDVPEYALVLLAGLAASAAVMIAAQAALGMDGPGFTSVFQGGIRFNNYVGLTVAAGLLGAPGLAFAALTNAVMVPTVNVLCVLVFARYGAGREAGWRGAARALATNPLILACALGAALNLSGLGLPGAAASTLRTLGQAGLPLGLLVVGAALDPSALRGRIGPTVAASAAKFFVVPTATALACAAVGLSGPAAASAVLFQALPTATSSYVLARQLGGDAPLMAAIIAVQTPLALASLPAALFALRATGLW
jgi:predicted permease